MDQEPTIGHIVHYVLDEFAEKHRPAIIVKVHEWRKTINLQVFTDGPNDVKDKTFWASSVENDEDHKSQGTWHWPERVQS
jgi:hypothetical protein